MEWENLCVTGIMGMLPITTNDINPDKDVDYRSVSVDLSTIRGVLKKKTCHLPSFFLKMVLTKILKNHPYTPKAF